MKQRWSREVDQRYARRSPALTRDELPIPPEDTSGCGFYDGADDNVENPTHMERYDDTDDDRNQDWTCVPTFWDIELAE